MRIKRKSKNNNEWKQIVQFCECTTLHGIRHLVAFNRHWTEILFWGVIVVLLFVGSTLMIYNSWYRFTTNPTVISLQKDYRTWKTAFPAATVCFADKLDSKLAGNFITKNWPNATGDEQEYFMSFLDRTANAGYKTLNNFEQFKGDRRLATLDLLKLASQVSVNMTYDARIFDLKFKDLNFLKTLTEMGICHTFGGVLSQSFAFQYRVSDTNYTRAAKHFKPPYCSFQNPLCYASIEDLPVNLSYYIHSAYEMPIAGTTGFTVLQNMERDTTFRFLETIASKELRNLQPEQRRCRFLDEPFADWTVITAYSYNICMMECRRRVAYKFCKCSPYFYLKNDQLQVCGVEGLACLSKYAKTLLTLKSQGPPFNCDCLPNCEDIKFFLDKNTKREWTHPVPSNIRFRWAIEIYSKTRLKRDIIYGFDDLLVSCGGTAAFFLGCSLLTFIEILYFFVARLTCYVCSRINRIKIYLSVDKY